MTPHKYLFLSLIFFLPLESKPLKVDISAPSAILINADTGVVLFEKDAHRPLHPASITKLATAVYALDKKRDSLDVMVVAAMEDLGTVTPQQKNAPGSKFPPHILESDGTHIGIKVGEILPFRALMYGMILASGNDAANVIAHHVSGSIPKFMEELDVFLKKNGICETIFRNPHGLHHPEHQTTASDMAKITQMGLKIPEFREIIKTVRYPRPETNKQQESVLTHSGRLLKSGQFYYPKAIGVKTGYTSLAGHTLVAAAQQDNRTLIAVLLHCSDFRQRYRDAINLFEAAFSQQMITRTLFSKEYDHYSLAVKGGKLPVEAVLKEDFKLDYYPAEEPQFKAELHWLPVKMPIVKDQQVGEIRLITNEGAILKTASLYSTQTVSKTTYFAITEFFGKLKALLFQKTGIIILLMMTTTLWATIYYFKFASREKPASEKE